MWNNKENLHVLYGRQFSQQLGVQIEIITVMPAKSDSDVVFFLQLLSKI